MEIYLAKTQGLCAGVSFAIDIVEKALDKYGSPLYVYHEIVHNTHVVNYFKDKGVVFIEDINDMPKDKVVIISAHGVPPNIIDKLDEMGLKYIDATCPLVRKVHNEAIKASKKDIQTILIGHKGHQEMIGTAGYVKPELLNIVEKLEDIDELNIAEDSEVAYITQTTLSVDESANIIDKLKDKFPKLISPPQSDLCYATQNRQDAVKELAGICDLIIICGSANSSNSNRLRETGEKYGCESIIIDSVRDLDISVLENKNNVGISSGASVPRVIVDDLISAIISKCPGTKINEFENPEKNIIFKVPEV